MSRFHVHVAVDDLAANIRFYSAMFGRPPTVEATDYAKWMLDDPRVNFAISNRGAPPGIDHLGLQVESGEALSSLRARFDAAALASVSETAAQCCYAVSDKHWTTDPQGIAWETFHTLDTIPQFGAAKRAAAAHAAADTAPDASATVVDASDACCAPNVARAPVPVAMPVPSSVASACCAKSAS